MKKSQFMFALFTFSIITISSNFAQKSQKKDFNKRISIMEKLNLTDAQQKKFDQLRYDQEEKAIDLKAKLQKNRLKLKKLLSTPNFNQNDFLNLTKNSSDLRSSIKELRIKTWLAVYNILDAKQKEVWTKHFSHMAKEFGGREFERPRFKGQNMRMEFMPPHPNIDKRDKIINN